MQYVRTYSNNIFSEDTYSEKRTNCDRLKEEVVDGIQKMILHVDGGTYTFTDANDKPGLVRHSFNYIAIKSDKKYMVIKESDVNKIEFFF